MTGIFCPVDAGEVSIGDVEDYEILSGSFGELYHICFTSVYMVDMCIISFPCKAVLHCAWVW